MISAIEIQPQIDDFLNGRMSRDYLLLHGDFGDVLKHCPAGCVDMVITSPPYWAVRRYSGHGQIGTEPTPDLYVEHLLVVLRQVTRVLKPTGSFWLNIGDTYRDKNLCGIPWRVAFALQSDGWILRNAIIWDKVKGNPCNAKDKLRNMYEHLNYSRLVALSQNGRTPVVLSKLLDTSEHAQTVLHAIATQPLGRFLALAAPAADGTP